LISIKPEVIFTLPHLNASGHLYFLRCFVMWQVSVTSYLLFGTLFSNPKCLSDASSTN